MEQIEYTRTVVPSSMRSPYWKYFGFPSDSSNNILTRQKIVCTICNTIIAYNKNTSNLRTHLMSKHIEIFKKIVLPSNVSVVQTRNTIDAIDSSKRQRVKVFDSDYEDTSPLHNDSFSPANCITLPEYGSIQSKSHKNGEIISTNTSDKINCETPSTDFIAFFPSNDTENAEATASENVFKDENVAETYIDVGLHEDHEQQLQSMAVMLADYLQTDLLPIGTLNELGFCKYNQQLTGLKVDDHTIFRVKEIIETRYINVNQTVTFHVKRLSQSKPFSLCFEIYEDNEHQDVLNIYFNYLNDEKADLISILYASCANCSGDDDVTQLVKDVNIKNCSGIVVNCLDKEFPFLLNFANIHELPLVECLESLLSRCLKKVFEKIEFYAAYKRFLKTVLENKNEISLAKFNLKTGCQWSPLIFLEHMFNTIDLEKCGNWDELKEIFEYLKPLKVTMDIIVNEPLPLCSLIRPMIKKLFESYFVLINQKETRKYQIQKILEEELYERIFGRTFLKEVTFFDIRFHRDFTRNEAFTDVTYFKAQVFERFKHILKVTNLNRRNTVMDQHSTDSFNTPKCSSLKSFFKRDVRLMNADFGSNLKTNLDIEFEQYYNQACLDLDQSPILWWEKQTANYEQLSKIAKYYLTIPCCCVPRLCSTDLEKRYSKLGRRSNLSQFCSTESKLWYLHYNDDVTQFL